MNYFITDINECEQQSHNCGQDECVNTEGSFRCNPKPRCPLGFHWDAQGNCIGMENHILLITQPRVQVKESHLLDTMSLVAQGLNATQTGDQRDCC